jgi:hypothetical protein
MHHHKIPRPEGLRLPPTTPCHNYYRTSTEAFSAVFNCIYSHSLEFHCHTIGSFPKTDSLIASIRASSRAKTSAKPLQIEPHIILLIFLLSAHGVYFSVKNQSKVCVESSALLPSG